MSDRRGPGSDPAAPAISSGTPDELRPVTALFADVVGSTSLGENLSPDEVKALIGECVGRMAAAVEEFGGVVQAYMGDGICAYFGVPVANEDDPERAARAGLKIVEAVQEYAADVASAWGITDFNVRVGINSGQTAVGLVGASDPQAVALGDTTNTAARLQSAAQPGTIAVGEPTAKRLTDRFVLEEIGGVTVKGKAEPVPAWQLVEQKEAEAEELRPIFGRDAELQRFATAIDELVGGRGQIVAVAGDSGIGKTRLLAELARLAGSKASVLTGRCLSYGGEMPYWPWVEILRDWLGVREGEAEIAVRTKLRARLDPLVGGRTAALLPYLGRLLSLKLDAQQEEELAALDRTEVSQRIQAAYAEWIEAMATRGPLLISIDDFHWADPPSLDIADELLAITDRAPVLFAQTIRLDVDSGARAVRIKALSDFAHRTIDLSLAPLSTEAAQAFADSLAPEVGLDAEAKETIVRLAEGNPLYLEELMQALIEGGDLIRKRTWTLTMRTEDFLPPALESLLVARIDRLPESARRLAQIAAVQGRNFLVPVLEKCAGEDIADDLAALLKAEIVREVRRYPMLQCTFKHGLVQEAALSSLTPTSRRELYGRVAQAHEDVFKDSLDDQLELLAFYYYRSEELPKAFEYLERAAKKAEGINADQAAELWGRAQKVAVKLGDQDKSQSSGSHARDLAPPPTTPTEAPERTSMLTIGEVLGRYTIEEHLGEGATGNVYRAVDDGGQTVALKVLKKELGHDDVFRRRFLHESRAAGEVDHDHLVKIVDTDEVDGLLYVAMTYLPGRSLEEMIEESGPLPAKTTIKIVRQIGAALDALHEKGIVHRDVKPSNIMVDTEGRAVLTDFGLAKGRAYTVLTRPGQVMGTLDYIAPEIIKGEEATAAADIYALACIAFECIAGRPPFADKGVFQVGMAHLVDEPPDPTAGRDDVPEALGWTILQALAKDPEQRPPSGTAFANLLRMAIHTR